MSHSQFMYMVFDAIFSAGNFWYHKFYTETKGSLGPKKQMNKINHPFPYSRMPEWCLLVFVVKGSFLHFILSKGKTGCPHWPVCKCNTSVLKTVRVAHDQTVHPWSAELVWPQTALSLATMMCCIFADWQVQQASQTKGNCPKFVNFITYKWQLR